MSKYTFNEIGVEFSGVEINRTEAHNLDVRYLEYSAIEDSDGDFEKIVDSIKEHLRMKKNEEK